MFEGLKNLANMASMARQSGEMQKKMADLKERIGRMEVEGHAGGDAVAVRISGDFQVRSVHIHQWLVEARNQQLLQQLTQDAVNSAIQKARDLTATEMARLAEELNIPGMQDAFSKLGLG
jgi:DNA-binding YbaB/EbfC family protein